MECHQSEDATLWHNSTTVGPLYKDNLVEPCQEEFTTLCKKFPLQVHFVLCETCLWCASSLWNERPFV